MNINDNTKVKELADKIFFIEEELETIEQAKDILKLTLMTSIGKDPIKPSNMEWVGMMLEKKRNLITQHKAAMSELDVVAKEEMGIDYEFLVDSDGTIVGKEDFEASVEAKVKEIEHEVLIGMLKAKDCDKCDSKDECPVRSAKEAFIMGASPADAAKLYDQKMIKC